jgi:hypothetical protein
VTVSGVLSSLGSAILGKANLTVPSWGYPAFGGLSTLFARPFIGIPGLFAWAVVGFGC